MVFPVRLRYCENAAGCPCTATDAALNSSSSQHALLFKLLLFMLGAHERSMKSRLTARWHTALMTSALAMQAMQEGH